MLVKFIPKISSLYLSNLSIITNTSLYLLYPEYHHCICRNCPSITNISITLSVETVHSASNLTARLHLSVPHDVQNVWSKCVARTLKFRKRISEPTAVKLGLAFHYFCIPLYFCRRENMNVVKCKILCVAQYSFVFPLLCKNWFWLWWVSMMNCINHTQVGIPSIHHLYVKRESLVSLGRIGYKIDNKEHWKQKKGHSSKNMLMNITSQ